jgi:hypothetical protein
MAACDFFLAGRHVISNIPMKYGARIDTAGNDAMTDWDLFGPGFSDYPLAGHQETGGASHPRLKRTGAAPASSTRALGRRSGPAALHRHHPGVFQMSETPKISFVMPTHNRIEWLPLAIDSLRSQTELNIEIVIVDDGSTDGTWDYLEWVAQDNRIRHLSQRDAARRWTVPQRRRGRSAHGDHRRLRRRRRVHQHARGEHLEMVREEPGFRTGYLSHMSRSTTSTTWWSPTSASPSTTTPFKARGEVSYYCNPATAYRKAAALAVGGYKREGEGITDDYQFLQNWVGAGKRVDYCGDLDGEIPFATMHRILPNSMMAKIRGLTRRWLRKSQ